MRASGEATHSARARESSIECSHVLKPKLGTLYQTSGKEIHIERRVVRRVCKVCIVGEKLFSKPRARESEGRCVPVRTRVCTHVYEPGVTLESTSGAEPCGGAGGGGGQHCTATERDKY